MIKKILFLILFLGTTVFYEIKSSPPNNSNSMQEEMITEDLIKRCLGKILDLDRHYWHYFAADIAQELSDNPWLLSSNRKNNNYITIPEKEEILSKTLKKLQLIAASSRKPDTLKQIFTNVVKTIYEKKRSQYRQ